MVVEVRFAPIADGRDVAYRVVTDAEGPLIIHTTSGPYPLDLLDEDPMYERFLRILGECGRLVLYDRPGFGSSDPIDRDRDFLDEMADAHVAVLEAVDADQAWIVSSLGPAIARTIQSHPDRVEGAVIINPVSPAQFRRNVDSAIERERNLPLAEMYPSRADDPAFAEWTRRAGRLGTSAADRAALFSANREAISRFVAEAEPILGAPPVLLIRRRYAMSAAYVRWWKHIFPDAESITVEGADVGLAASDAGLIAELAVGFITGEPVQAPPLRRLVAVLFTDLVDSTNTAATSGDLVWRSTLDRYEASLQHTIQRHHGTLVKHTGDGALATFSSGSEAVAAAISLANSTPDLGLEGRTGIHVGEVEKRGDDIGGIAVHLAARVMDEARPGEIIVTSTVVESSMGGRTRFSDRGIRALKGIDRPWQLFALEPDHR